MSESVQNICLRAKQSSKKFKRYTWLRVWIMHRIPHVCVCMHVAWVCVCWCACGVCRCMWCVHVQVLCACMVCTCVACMHACRVCMSASGHGCMSAYMPTHLSFRPTSSPFWPLAPPVPGTWTFCQARCVSAPAAHPRPAVWSYTAPPANSSHSLYHAAQ